MMIALFTFPWPWAIGGKRISAASHHRPIFPRPETGPALKSTDI